VPGVGSGPLLQTDDLVAADARIDDGPHAILALLGIVLLAMGAWPVIVDADLVRVERGLRGGMAVACRVANEWGDVARLQR
jgi:hypothetical protein